VAPSSLGRSLMVQHRQEKKLPDLAFVVLSESCLDLAIVFELVLAGSCFRIMI
jgi:hypothetical protein